MVYVDELQTYPSKDPIAHRVGARHGHKWCHMWTDDPTLEELHQMARRIGLRVEWFQPKRGFPHYDLVPPRRAEALMCGAEFMPARTAAWGRLLLNWP